MQLHADALFSGIACQSLPELVIAGILSIDPGIDFDAAIVMAVPLVHHFHKLLTLFIGLKIEIFVLIDEAVGRKGPDWP